MAELEDLKKVAERFERRSSKMRFIRTAAIVTASMFIAYGPVSSWIQSEYPDDHIAIIRISGVITSGNSEGDGLKLAEAMSRAFQSDKAKAILIVANSPGGSPVQAEMLYSTINYYKNKFDKPVWVSMEDACASACYWMSTAADKILAHESTLTGSIGIRMDMWNLSEVISDYHVNRITLASGDEKTLLDPYQEFSEHDAQTITDRSITPMFESFVSAVESGREGKLSKEQDLYSGRFWVGKDAAELGLIDDILATPLVIEEMKSEYGASKIKRYNGRALNLQNMLNIATEQFANYLSISASPAYK